MSVAETDLKDLILRVLGGNNDNTLIPIKTSTCKLSKSVENGQSSECCIKRDEEGVEILSLKGELKVNGVVIQRQRLRQGDRIDFGPKQYEVHQLGFVGEPNSGSYVESESQDKVDNRIQKIEDELGKQSQNFDSVNKRFDDLSQQMAMLLNAIGGESPASEEVELPQVEAPQVEAPQVETSSVEIPSAETSSVKSAGSTEVQTVSPPQQIEPVKPIPPTVENKQELQPSEAVQEVQEREAEEKPQADVAEVQEDEKPVAPLHRPIPEEEPISNLLHATPQSPQATSEYVDQQAKNSNRADDVSDRLAAATAKAEAALAKSHSYDSNLATSHVEDAPLQGSVDESSQANNFEQSAASNNLDSVLAKLSESNETQQVNTEGNSLPLETNAETESVATEAPVNGEIEPAGSEKLDALFASLRQKDEAEAAKHAISEISTPSLETVESEEPEVNPLLAAVTQNIPSQSSDAEPQSESEDPMLAAMTQNQVEQTLPQATTESEIENPLLAATLDSASLSNEAPFDVNESRLSASGSESVEAETTAEEAPQQESVAELLARMNLSPNDGDSPSAAEAVNVVEAEVVEAEPTTQATNDEPTSKKEVSTGNDEDVADYMSSLLQRLNQSPGDEVAEPEVVAEPEPEPAPPVEPVRKLNPEEFVPKRVAPELNSNLAAMRELANATSRNAVHHSEVKKRKEGATSLLLGAIASMIGAIVTSILSAKAFDVFYCLSIGLFLTTAFCSGIFARANLFSGSAAPAGGNPSFFATLKNIFSRSNTGD
ncbi:MAG: hypothetical protein AAGA30_11290 [Planctomycetota bacterium]